MSWYTKRVWSLMTNILKFVKVDALIVNDVFFIISLVLIIFIKHGSWFGIKFIDCSVRLWINEIYFRTNRNPSTFAFYFLILWCPRIKYEWNRFAPCFNSNKISNYFNTFTLVLLSAVSVFVGISVHLFQNGIWGNISTNTYYGKYDP